MIITNDPGGYTYEYIARAHELAAHHETVIIDGFCASGCTFYTSIPNVCATDKARLFFHSSYFLKPDGRRVYDPKGTAAQMRVFPERVRQAVKARGGLTPAGWWITGQEAVELVGPCSNASAGGARNQ